MNEQGDPSIHAAAVTMVDARRVMAIATVRADGWPQNTIVGYANEGLTLYFLIFRSSQKFRNIAHDDRVALAIGEQPANLHFAEAVYASGHAAEVVDPQEREQAWQLLVKRHPNLGGREMPDRDVSGIMRARCEHVSVLDYNKGLGHTETLELPQG
jgi:nitroimidazol reductase NimA-like FMN-containing flavoprotein (pyridoxamine 5'-phosphate oxidase superfamily)